MTPLTKVEEIIEKLELQKHPIEGGYFSETYRSPLKIDCKKLIPGYQQQQEHLHSLSTAIYYLLIPGTFSELHRLPIDEIFHFYAGSPVEMLQLFPDGSGKKILIGNDISKGHSPQVIAPAGVWQGTRLLEESENAYALMGTTMAPGFDFADYTSGNRLELIESYPQYKELIMLLTRDV